MKLSKNFTLQEFEASSVADEKRITNNAPAIEIDHMMTLCKEVLQPLRDWLGIPIIITSGYRCHALNKIIKGSLTSDHTKGRAVDFVLPDDKHKEYAVHAFACLKHKLCFDQLIWEKGNAEAPKWIHVSYRSKEQNREEVLALVDGGYQKFRYAYPEADKRLNELTM